MDLTREQRDNRDQLSARAAIDMAQRDLIAAIAVDDARASKKMLRRVRDIATSMGIEFDVKRHDGWIDVWIGAGCVRIVRADKIAEELGWRL